MAISSRIRVGAKPLLVKPAGARSRRNARSDMNWQPIGEKYVVLPRIVFTQSYGASDNSRARNRHRPRPFAERNGLCECRKNRPLPKGCFFDGFKVSFQKCRDCDLIYAIELPNCGADFFFSVHIPKLFEFGGNVARVIVEQHGSSK